MKKIVLTLCMFLLVGCTSTPTTTETTSNIEALNFEQQLALANIELTCEDPNAGMYDFTSTDASVDLKTGASGPALYAGEDEAPAIKTAEDLVSRKSTMYYKYIWEAKEEDGAVKTLEEAAKLEDAKYVTDLFPNDGQAYVITKKQNSLGTVVISTVSEDKLPNAAIFGISFSKDEATNKVLGGGTLMAYTETVSNILRDGNMVMTYYEYNPTEIAKVGVGTRNAGARVELVLDEKLSMMIGTKDDSGVTPEYTVEEYKKLDQEAKDKFKASYLKMQAEVIEVYSIG